MLNAAKKNPGKFCLSIAAFALGLIGLIVYLAAGRVPGYTETLSTGAIIALALAVCGNLVFSLVRCNTVESLPFAAYIVGVMLVLYANAEYLVAVVRAIDVTTVQPSLIAVVALSGAAAVLYAVSFLMKKKQ